MTMMPMYDFTEQLGTRTISLLLAGTNLEDFEEKISPDKGYMIKPEMVGRSSLFRHFQERNMVLSGRDRGRSGQIRVISSDNESDIGDSYDLKYAQVLQEVNMEHLFASRIGSRVDLSYRDNNYPAITWGIITGYKGKNLDMVVFSDGDFVDRETFVVGDSRGYLSRMEFPNVKNDNLPFSPSCVFSLTKEAEDRLGVAPETRLRYLNHDLEGTERIAFTTMIDGEVTTVYGDEISSSTRDYGSILPELSAKEREISSLEKRTWDTLLTKREELLVKED